jgi:hypothetical protein
LKKLIYVPIIHTSADLGSLAEDVSNRGILVLGEELWKKHLRTIDNYWNVISAYFDSLEVSGFKIYQDGMVTEGEIARKIVEDGIKCGSKNFELILKLINRGAVLIKTEDINLVKKEHDMLIRITKAKTKRDRLVLSMKYEINKNELLKKRDEFIAKRINLTLKHGETGIIFIGAYHNIERYLSNDIEIYEVKEREKVQEYQKLLPLYTKNKARFEKLSKYLVQQVVIPNLMY